MIRTVTASSTKLHIPTLITPSGRRLMSVNRNELLRYVSFADIDQAQHAIDAVKSHDLLHVTGEILVCKVPRVPQDGEMIVWETSVECIMSLAGPPNFGVDLCDFVTPNFVLLEAVFVSPRKTPSDYKRRLEDMLKL